MIKHSYARALKYTNMIVYSWIPNGTVVRARAFHHFVAFSPRVVVFQRFTESNPFFPGTQVKFLVERMLTGWVEISFNWDYSS